jgi:hypothetical protein
MKRLDKMLIQLLLPQISQEIVKIFQREEMRLRANKQKIKLKISNLSIQQTSLKMKKIRIQTQIMRLLVKIKPP